MFSQRIAPPRHAPAFVERVRALREAGEPLWDLTQTNPTRLGLDYPEAEILAALSQRELLGYAPDALGLPLARQAIAEHYRSLGVNLEPEQLVLTASTSEAYGVLFKLLCDPGDNVLVPRPSYPLFDVLAGLEAVEVRNYSLAYDGAWHLDWTSLLAAKNPQSRAIVCVSPNNPTGSCLRPDEHRRLKGLNLPLIVDEVFLEYPLAGPALSPTVFEADGLCFSLGGLSKLAGLPQLKLAWIGVTGQQHLVEAALGRLELILDSMLSVSAGVQWALPTLLKLAPRIRDQLLARCRKNNQTARRLCNGTAVTALSCEGGWQQVLRLPETLTETEASDEAWALKLLCQKQVIVQPGWFYDFERGAYLVLSLITEPRQFEEGLRRILDAAG